MTAQQQQFRDWLNERLRNNYIVLTGDDLQETGTYSGRWPMYRSMMQPEELYSQYLVEVGEHNALTRYEFFDSLEARGVFAIHVSEHATILTYSIDIDSG